jgi:hypothetical protein
MIISIPLPTIDGQPTEVDTAVLRDPTESFGIRIVDGEEVVVAAGTALALVDDTYQFDFEDAELGVSYEAWFELAYDGDVYRTSYFFTAGDSSTSITYVFRAAFADADGEMLELVDPVELRNPSSTYGAKRLSDNLIIAAAGTVMTADGAGLYSASILRDTDDETERFRFYVSAIVNTKTYYLPSVTNGQMRSVALALGRYTDSYLVGQMVGHDNVYLWAGTPQYGTAEADEPVDFVLRMSQFIRDAEDWLDAELFGAYVTEAFTDTIPTTIVKLATSLAAIAMYESRGVDDTGEGGEGPTNRLSGMKRQALKDIRRIKMGLLKVGTLGYGPSFGFAEVDLND